MAKVLHGLREKGALLQLERGTGILQRSPKVTEMADVVVESLGEHNNVVEEKTQDCHLYRARIISKARCNVAGALHKPKGIFRKR